MNDFWIALWRMNALIGLGVLYLAMPLARGMGPEAEIQIQSAIITNEYIYRNGPPWLR